MNGLFRITRAFRAVPDRAGKAGSSYLRSMIDPSIAE
jgi:hypothetical protein